MNQTETLKRLSCDELSESIHDFQRRSGGLIIANFNKEAPQNELKPNESYWLAMDTERLSPDAAVEPGKVETRTHALGKLPIGSEVTMSLIPEVIDLREHFATDTISTPPNLIVGREAWDWLQEAKRQEAAMIDLANTETVTVFDYVRGRALVQNGAVDEKNGRIDISRVGLGDRPMDNDMFAARQMGSYPSSY